MLTLCFFQRQYYFHWQKKKVASDLFMAIKGRRAEQIFRGKFTGLELAETGQQTHFSPAPFLFPRALLYISYGFPTLVVTSTLFFYLSRRFSKQVLEQVLFSFRCIRLTQWEHIKLQILGAGEMALPLRECTFLTEDSNSCSVPSTHIGQHTAACISRSKSI